MEAGPAGQSERIHRLFARLALGSAGLSIGLATLTAASLFVALRVRENPYGEPSLVGLAYEPSVASLVFLAGQVGFAILWALGWLARRRAPGRRAAAWAAGLVPVALAAQMLLMSQWRHLD